MNSSLRLHLKTNSRRLRTFSLVLLTRALVYGGAERQLVALAAGLHRKGHRVIVLTYYKGGGLAPVLEASGVPHASLDKRSRWDLVGPGLRARRILKQLDPDVIHGYLEDSNVAAAILRLWVPRARLVTSIRGTRLDFAHYPPIVRVMFWLGVWSARMADLTISNSHSGAADCVAAGYPKDRIQVIPNGIDTEFFRPDQSRRSALREAWECQPGDQLIGIVGRLAPMKDHPTFLRAAAQLAANHSNVRFVCVGDGPDAYRQHLMALAVELGLGSRVRWLPAQADVRGVYGALDLLTSSSSSGEGFSNVIGEAMACGTHCVVTDAGDSARIVGPTGIVVVRRDPEALADGWRRGLAAVAKDELPDPRERIKQEFSLDKLVMRTEVELGNLLDRSGEPGP